MNRDEEFQARKDATAEVKARLQSRGIEVTGDEQPEALADLLSAVERFEQAVQAPGGPLMVDGLKNSRPDHVHFRLPRTPPGEPPPPYNAPCIQAAPRLVNHPQ